MTTLLAWLKQRSDIRLIGPDDPEVRVPTISFLPKNKSLDEVFAALTAKKLMAGQGHFYGVRPLMGMHIPIETGVLRLSFLHYTTEDEITRPINAAVARLKDIATGEGDLTMRLTVKTSVLYIYGYHIDLSACLTVSRPRKRAEMALLFFGILI